MLMFDYKDRLYFVPDIHFSRVPQKLRGQGVQVTLIEPDDIASWPEGADRPQAVFCVSKSDPKVFRLCRSTKDIPRISRRWASGPILPQVVSNWT